jgi:hypothetical protein
MHFREGPAKKIIRVVGLAAPFFDIILAPFTLVSVIWFRVVRYWGVKNMNITKWIFLRLGLFPVVDHYYEPLFDHRKVPEPRNLETHLDFNDEVQYAMLGTLTYGNELLELQQYGDRQSGQYYYDNGSFGPGDAELYYSLIRRNKPRRILEVGSGFSTLMALKAIERNKEEDRNYDCTLTCIEPYEMPYLERLNIQLVRKKIEDIDPAVFADLQKDDILFIDSSHMIRPGGDVDHLILKKIHTLGSGVWIHFHDIFLPRGYPVAWLRDEFRMWNEQYLLEAFLISNHNFEIMGALNYLNNKYPEEVARALPVLGHSLQPEPGSFWIRKK